MKSGLKSKLLVSLLVPVLLIIAGLSFYNYYAAKNALDTQITKAASYATGNYVGDINAQIDGQGDGRQLAGLVHGFETDEHGRTGGRYEKP